MRTLMSFDEHSLYQLPCDKRVLYGLQQELFPLHEAGESQQQLGRSFPNDNCSPANLSHACGFDILLVAGSDSRSKAGLPNPDELLFKRSPKRYLLTIRATPTTQLGRWAGYSLAKTHGAWT